MQNKGFNWYCDACDHIIDVASGDSSTVPCPDCGAPANRRNVRRFGERLVFGDMISMKQRRPGFKGPILETKKGASRAKDGTLSQVEQIVDKRDSQNKRYRKKVVLADGKVVKDVEGPLTDQTLHGPQKPGAQ